MSISSGAGLSGFEFNSAYAAAKFGLEGWMESLQPEVAPFGITITRQARARPHHDRQPGAAAAPLHRRRRCHRHRRAEGEGPAGAGERPPDAVDQRIYVDNVPVNEALG
jgi:NAD(P)-dependent dehydrogenase (short-subunit alcohol dehydrogenase family)